MSNQAIEKHSKMEYLQTAIEDNEIKKNWQLDPKKQLALFTVGWLGLSIIALIVSLLVQMLYKYRFPDPIAYEIAINSIGYSTAVNVVSYIILFMLLVYIALDYFKVNYKLFYKPSHIVKGIGYGGIVLLSSVSINLIYQMLQINISDNVNESSVTTIMKAYPLFAFLAFVLAGPICEELTYRLGLFDLSKRKNKYLAYVAVPLLFGLIHFDFTTTNLTNELLNLPTYIIAGLIFCYIHEKEDFSISVYAHITNNLVAFLVTFFLSNSLVSLI